MTRQPPITTLWRPVGHKELELIQASGYTGFPPRLPEQPIFYPVCNFEYAEQIARDWNSNDERHDYVGYVTEFDLRSDYLAAYITHVVGGQQHREYWIPAEGLQNFNEAIVEPIRLVAEYRHGQRLPASSEQP